MSTAAAIGAGLGDTLASACPRFHAVRIKPRRVREGSTPQYPIRRYCARCRIWPSGAQHCERARQLIFATPTIPARQTRFAASRRACDRTPISDIVAFHDLASRLAEARAEGSTQHLSPTKHRSEEV
jgi:hypothetical protein